MAHQIAVFAENKPGRIERVSRILGEAGVNIRAITVATADAFGVIKLLVDDPAKAAAALAAGGVPAVRREIVAIVMEDRPGGLLAATQALSAAGINIEDAYGFVIEDKKRAVLVVEVEKIPEAVDVLRENFGDLVFDTTVTKTIRFAEAPVKGMSVIKYDPKGKAAEA